MRGLKNYHVHALRYPYHKVLQVEEGCLYKADETVTSMFFTDINFLLK